MPILCHQPTTEQTTCHRRYPGFHVWPIASDERRRGSYQEEGLQRSPWRSLREELPGKASTAVGTQGKERPPNSLLGWTELVRLLREVLWHPEGPGLLLLFRGMKERSQ